MHAIVARWTTGVGGGGGAAAARARRRRSARLKLAVGRLVGRPHAARREQRALLVAVEVAAVVELLRVAVDQVEPHVPLAHDLEGGMCVLIIAIRRRSRGADIDTR